MENIEPRRLKSYEKAIKDLTYEQVCKVNTLLWDYYQELLEAFKNQDGKEGILSDL